MNANSLKHYRYKDKRYAKNDYKPTVIAMQHQLVLFVLEFIKFFFDGHSFGCLPCECDKSYQNQYYSDP